MEAKIPILKSTMVNPGPEKKLKRGLGDLSPLFQSPPRPTGATRSFPQSFFEVQFLTACVPDHEGDAFLANAYLASQMVRQEHLLASLVSITPAFNAVPFKSTKASTSLERLNSRISRLVLSHQELWSFTQNGLAREASPPFEPGTPAGSFLIFLEFEPAQFRSLARIALLLDRVILFTQPQGDSLREAYRLMKIFAGLNREIEFLLLFREKVSPRSRAEFLFERFSLITSRFLGVSTVWLGDLSFPEKGGRSWVPSEENVGFNPEPILLGEGLRRPLSPEKSRFWHWLQRMLQTRSSR